MKLIRTFIILLAIILVFGAAMFALNLHTGPIIESNNTGAQFAPLLSVMPEGAKFDGDALIYDSANASSSALTDIPESVSAIYKETAGMGFAIRAKATSQYSSAPMIITVGVDGEGKICGIGVDEYYDTPSFDFRAKDPEYLGTYIGKDSALSDVGIVAGSTFSSTAFRGAVEDALGVLVTNELIEAGKKDDSQILTELIPTVHAGMSNTANATAVTPSGNIVSGLMAENGSGFAYIMTDGGASYLAIVNATGACKIYDVEANDVTSDKSALVAEAKAHAASNQKDFAADGNKRFGLMIEGAGEMTPIEIDSFNNVVYAASFTAGGAQYYGFYARAKGFKMMDIYIVLDENGAIAELDAKALIFDEEYFGSFNAPGYTAGEYKNSFTGLTEDTFTGENTIIATATMTSNTVKLCTNDVFAAFNALKGGEQ